MLNNRPTVRDFRGRGNEEEEEEEGHREAAVLHGSTPTPHSDE